MTDTGTEGFSGEGARVFHASRRDVFSRAARLAACGGLITITACGGSEESPLANMPTPTPSGTPAPTPTATPTIASLTDADMLVLMVQLHYLQAEFYARAVLGAPLSAALVGGTGTPGAVTGPRQVAFTDPVLGDMMREIAVEKIEQLVRLRAALAGATPARPALNLGGDENGAFTRYGRESNDVPAATGGAPRGTYDVYADQERFLLGAFILEDGVVAAWRNIAALLTSSVNVDVAVGLLAGAAHHAGLVRNQIFLRGAAAGSTLYASATRLSDLRDTYSRDEDDQAVGGGTGAGIFANITPADGDGEVFGRPPQITVNVFYMTRAAATAGGFFPAGLSGTLQSSIAI